MGNTNPRNTGRVCGGFEPINIGDLPPTPVLSNNFASTSMRLEDGDYGSFNPSGGPVAGDGDANDDNGLSIANSSFYGESFWTSANPNGPGFNSGGGTAWSFMGITGRGYPVLEDLGGQ